MATTNCPVLYPSLQEFEDFESYIKLIENSDYCSEYGVVKVVPPKGWFEGKYDWENWKLKVKSPVKQIITGRAGVFTVNLLELKDMPIAEFERRASKNSCPDATPLERERKFWKSLGNPCGWEDPIYGADMVGSLFPKDKKIAWNVDNLKNPLKLIQSDLPGISSAMLYFGSWRSMFAFHTEDLDLYSINYLHYGAAKSWYSIPASHKKRLESLAHSYFMNDFWQCHEFLRHKTTLLSPTKLKEGGIPFHTVLQNPGEFVITFPGAYHAGFNHGFNMAEATNFATEIWLDIGREAKVCKCNPDSVRIDINHFETLICREKIKSLKMNSADSPNEDDQIMIMRCSCSVRSHICNSKDKDDAAMFKCYECGLWCHVNCIYNDDNASQVPLRKLCHMCLAINDQNESNSVATSSRSVKSVTLNVDIGDMVRVKYEASGEESELFYDGLVVDVKDNLFRFHAKGYHRDSDLWISTSDIERYEILCKKEVNNNPKKRKNSSEKKNKKSKSQSQQLTITPQKDSLRTATLQSLTNATCIDLCDVSESASESFSTSEEDLIPMSTQLPILGHNQLMNLISVDASKTCDF